MAVLDGVFQKSNLEESKKKAKMLFGRMLINLRKNGRFKLYSLLESVNENDMIDGSLTLVLSDKVSFEMLNNQHDIDELIKVAQGINSAVTSIKLECNGKEPFDKFKFETRLKEEFGKILVIKKD